MRAPYKFAATALFAALAFVPAEAHAGTTSPLSSLAALPGPIAIKAPELPTSVPGAVVRTKDGSRGTIWHDIDAATGRGYCLASHDGGSRWMGTYGLSSRSAAEVLDLDRLVEKDGKATLERTRVHFDPAEGTLTATGRSRVELHEVARTPAGIVVWAYRDGNDVVVLARNIERGQESAHAGPDEMIFPFVSAESCPFAGGRLDAAKPEAGSALQLVGNLPARGTGKEKVIPTFIVDASLSRVARDPEARLAVRVRVHD